MYTNSERIEVIYTDGMGVVHNEWFDADECLPDDATNIVICM